MIKATSNISVIVKAKLEQIKALNGNPDAILRTVAMAVLPEFKKRIHIDGKDSNGNQIGTYTPSYMVVRTGNYKNAKTKRDGTAKERKGKGDAGVSRTGTTRPVYNRTSDPKVVISLTRQMENDLNVVATPTGYGLGYLNSDNRTKADYVEATYNKKILTKLTKEEKELAIKTATEFIPEYLKTI